MGKFLPRRYFIEKEGWEPVEFAPVMGVMAEFIASRPSVREVTFRKWFETMWQRSDYTEPPDDIPTERDYWEKWV